MQDPEIIYSVYEGIYEGYCIGHAKTREIAEAVVAFRQKKQDEEFTELLEGLTEEEIKEEKENRYECRNIDKLFIVEEDLYTQPEHITINHFYINLTTFEFTISVFVRNCRDRQINVYDKERPIADGIRNCLHVRDSDKNRAFKRAIEWLEQELAGDDYHEDAVKPDMQKMKEWARKEALKETK